MKAVLARWGRASAVSASPAARASATADYNCATSRPIWELHSHFHFWKEAVARFARLPVVDSNNDCPLRFLI
jgi:hypothetical protein